MTHDMIMISGLAFVSILLVIISYFILTKNSKKTFSEIDNKIHDDILAKMAQLENQLVTHEKDITLKIDELQKDIQTLNEKLILNIQKIITMIGNL